MDPRRGEDALSAQQSLGTAVPRLSTSTTSASTQRPVLDPKITERFIPIRSNPPAGAALVYKPMLLACASIYFRDTKTGANQQQNVCLLGAITDDLVAVDWSHAQSIDIPETDLEREPQSSASFAALPAPAAKASNFDAWKKSFAEYLYRTQELKLFRSDRLGVVSNPGESERDFRVRLSDAARQQRDEQVEKLRGKYASKFTTLQDRIRRAQQSVQREQEQASASKWNTAISVGSTLLGAFLGRKTFSAGNIGRATTAARGASRSYKESQDVARAGENVAALEQQLADLQAQFDTESGEIAAALDPQRESFQSFAVKPAKTDITVRSMILAWAPYWQSSAGEAPAF
jgi:hypothetical protein